MDGVDHQQIKILAKGTIKIPKEAIFRQNLHSKVPIVYPFTMKSTISIVDLDVQT